MTREDVERLSIRESAPIAMATIAVHASPIARAALVKPPHVAV